ncbi:MAG: hypothetical protein K2J93_00780 [Anaeroplasmataceae bacterium]|nr:hypothetical protein [Anaeroplasmataceae bacterium]
MTKLSKISFFLFVSVYNYLWLRIIMFPYFYNTYGNMGVYYTAIIAVAMILVFAFLPKRLMQHDYVEGFKKSNFKYFYSAILLLENIFGVTFCLYLLSKIFIPSGNYYIMLGFVAIVLVALSYYQPKDIMEIATLFIILGYAILTLTLFFYPDLDTSLLFPIKETSIISLPIFVVLFFGDNLTFLINKKDVEFTKLNFIMAIFSAFILFGVEYFILITNAGDTLFKGLNGVGFISLSIEPISKYIGNFEFAYVFYILISCIFKYSYNLSVLRNSIEIHKHFMAVVLFIMIVALCSVCYIFIPLQGLYLRVVAVLLLCGFLILFWFLKECYHVRKTEE